ncbi:hypothetical protein VP01_3466g1, partial [Puccinia sorghi]
HFSAVKPKSTRYTSEEDTRLPTETSKACSAQLYLSPLATCARGVHYLNSRSLTQGNRDDSSSWNLHTQTRTPTHQNPRTDAVPLAQHCTSCLNTLMSLWSVDAPGSVWVNMETLESASKYIDSLCEAISMRTSNRQEVPAGPPGLQTMKVSKSFCSIDAKMKHYLNKDIKFKTLPKLSLRAQCYFYITTTSTSSKQVFSKGKLIIYWKLSALKPKSIEQLLCSKDLLQTFEVPIQLYTYDTREMNIFSKIKLKKKLKQTEMKLTPASSRIRAGEHLGFGYGGRPYPDPDPQRF